MHWRLVALGRRLERWLAPRSRLPHAAAPLVTPTADGSGQVTHPDLLWFPRGWRGHPYWMAVTPYPFLDDTRENPAILVSDDGLSWAPPAGCPDPLVGTPEQGYHADPDLIHHPGRDELWLYYLHTVRGGEQRVLLLRSADGRHWEGPRTLFTLPYQGIRSPALAWEGGELVMWSINMSAGQILEQRRSPDGLQWGPPRPCSYRQPGHLPSHIDVVALPGGAGWRMVVQAHPPGDGRSLLFWAASRDGCRWRGARSPLLSPWDAPPWGARTLYRTTFIPDGERVRLWYSVRSADNRNHLAVTAAPLELLESTLLPTPAEESP